MDSARRIENLLHTYAERMDAGDLAGLADLFEGARIEPAPGVVVEGRDEVLAMYEGSARLHGDGTPRTKHVTTNAIIDVDDDTGTATSRSYFTVFQATDDLPLQPIITGRYHDSFRRIDGGWCFETRRMFVDEMGDLSHHLKYEL